MLFCITGFKTAIAQQNLLSLDEHNKYIYYEVADMPGLDADSLQLKATQFLKSSFSKSPIKENTTGKTIAGGKFLIYGSTGLFRHETGQVSYTLNMEFKDQKYRFWLTNFVCTPYQRDRYGNFVPDQGIDIPLESANDKFEKKQAESYLDQTGAFCKQFGQRLKAYLLASPTQKKVEIKRKTIPDKW